MKRSTEKVSWPPQVGRALVELEAVSRMGKMRSLPGRAFRNAAFTIEPPEPQVDLSDGYVIWLRFANAGMLSRSILYLMDYALS